MNENCNHEEIKGRLNSGNACFHSVQNLLSSHPLSKKIKRLKDRKLEFYFLFCVSVKPGLSH
jgi:hypothetical protein